MVCDEAQKIKTPGAMVSRAARKQNARFKIACTGTPVENTLTDLWCLFDFIQPGMLGSQKDFGERLSKTHGGGNRGRKGATGGIADGGLRRKRCGEPKQKWPRTYRAR